MIRAVIFDCFGPLYADPVLALRHDGRTPEHIVAALTDIDDRASVGELSKPMYVERVSRLLKISPEEVESRFFHGSDRNQEALDLILDLRANHKTCLLTNIGEGMLEGYFSKEELQTYFDLTVQSYQIKTAKPDPAVFRWTCEQLGVLPQEAVMVDDTVFNLQAAAAIGMHTVQFEDNEQMKAKLAAILTA